MTSGTFQIEPLIDCNSLSASFITLEKVEKMDWSPQAGA